MTRAHVILVATDFSDAANLALQQAWQLATQREDGELHVVHVVDDRGVPMRKRTRLARHDRVLQELPPQMKNQAIRLAQRIELAPLHRAFQVHVRFGRPAEEILALAVELDAAMVVVGSHDRGGLDRLVMGSVADAVVHAGLLPVLVSRPKRFDATYAESSEAPEPPCPACVAVQRASGGAELWCERHSRPYVRPHVYAGRGDFTKRPFDAEGSMGAYR